ncbi:hypothetical protein ACRAWF_16920 [Streptomyces sp. L7]
MTLPPPRPRRLQGAGGRAPARSQADARQASPTAYASVGRLTRQRRCPGVQGGQVDRSRRAADASAASADR